MSRVFVSHAAADKVYAEEFVDSVLVRAGGLRVTDDIFFSSGVDTGVASGDDLMAAVRGQAAETVLLVALVTPTFQTRPVCVAELGAAWARNILFPLMSPGMSRSELDGILPGLAIRASDESAYLDELAERLKAVGFAINITSWGVGKQKWLSYLRNHPDVVASPIVSTPAQVARIEADLDEARAALDESLERVALLESQVEALRLTKDADEVNAILLPEDESKRFDILRDMARESLREIGDVVGEAIWFDLAEGGMPRPQFMDDPDRFNSIERARRDGFLVEGSSDLLSPSADFPDVEAAMDAIEELEIFLKGSGDQFQAWFKSTYRVAPTLRAKACWNILTYG